MGHAYSIGWADDQLATVGECYSGSFCAGPRYFVSEDQTPEEAQGSTTWSLMTAGTATFIVADHFAYSIEELSTIDNEDIPSRDD